MVSSRDESSDGRSAVVEHYIDIPPSVHTHCVQVSSSPKKHVVSVERYDLLQTTAARAEEDDTLIAARLNALNLYARPNGLTPASPARKRDTTSPSDVFVTAIPTPSHSAHPESVADNQVIVDGTPTDGTPTDSTPIDEQDYIPVHLRWVGGRRDRASYAVPQYIRELYPSDVTDWRGWKEKRYYVVVRGYEIGIFFDFWARIKPFGFVPGAMAKGFNRFDAARDFWRQEVTDDNIRLLYRSS